MRDRFPRGGDEGAAERLPDKGTVRLQAGDVLRVLTPGAGGWGTSSTGAATVAGGRVTVTGRIDRPALHPSASPG